MKNFFLSDWRPDLAACGGHGRVGEIQIYGDSRLPLMEIQSSIVKDRRGSTGGWKSNLSHYWNAPMCQTSGARIRFARWLQVIGTPASIPALENLGRSEDWGFSKVYALMSYPRPEANAALLRLLENLPMACAPK